MNEYIKELIEQRIIEANKKQITSKLYSIAKNLGKPVISQGIFADDLVYPWENTEEDLLYDPEKIPTIEVDEWVTSERGFYFDGLQCGINFCVCASTYEDKLIQIKATYNGYIVYAEVDGEIKSYAPFTAWEDHLEMFYDASLTMEKKKQIENKACRQETNKKKLSIFWDRIRKLWGY